MSMDWRKLMQNSSSFICFRCLCSSESTWWSPDCRYRGWWAFTLLGQVHSSKMHAFRFAHVDECSNGIALKWHGFIDAKKMEAITSSLRHCNFVDTWRDSNLYKSRLSCNLFIRLMCRGQQPRMCLQRRYWAWSYLSCLCLMAPTQQSPQQRYSRRLMPWPSSWSMKPWWCWLCLQQVRRPIYQRPREF